MVEGIRHYDLMILLVMILRHYDLDF